MNKKLISILLVVCMLMSLLPGLGIGVAFAYSATNDTYVPLEVSGFNKDVVVEKDASDIAAAATPFDGENLEACWALYEKRDGANWGLPTNGRIGNGKFILEPYKNTNNSLQVDAQSTTGSLTFENQTGYPQIAFLGAGGNGYTYFKAVITYTDGTKSAPLEAMAPDWYLGEYAGFKEGPFGRMKIATGDGVSKGTIQGENGPNLYAFTIVTDQTKAIQSIDFEFANGNTGTDKERLNIMAVSGVIPANTYSVTFDANNGGSGTMVTVTGITNGGTSYTLPANGFTPTEGNTFLGWSTTTDGAILSPGSAITITQNTTVYARWDFIGDNVAQVGDARFTTLAEAIGAATADTSKVTLLKNVTLEDDVVLNKNIEFNLNGKTLETNGFTVQVDANVTLTGGTMSNSSSTDAALLYVTTGGSLTIENGTFTSNTPDVLFVEGDCIVKDGTYKVTAEAGSFDTRCVIVASGEDANLTVEGGSVITPAGAGDNGMYGVFSKDGAQITLGKTDKTGPSITSYFPAIGGNNYNADTNFTIYGGSYTSSFANVTSYAKFCAAVYLPAGGNINISGGTFNSVYAISVPYKNTSTNLAITGGTFTSTTGVFYIGEANAVYGTGTPVIAVSGGTFSHSFAVDYLVTGYELKTQGSKYVVMPAGARIYIDSTYKDAFLGGDYIELGLRPNGAFGTKAEAPKDANGDGVEDKNKETDVFFHPTESWYGYMLGLRSNGDKKWTEGINTDDKHKTVDFFLPGTIDEGWLVGWTTDTSGEAIVQGGAQACNSNTGDDLNITHGIVDASVSKADGKTVITAVTTATVNSAVDLVQEIEFDVSKKFFTTTVTLTNKGNDTIYDLSYIRAFDPDQRSGITGSATDNYFYKDSAGKVWVMAFGNNSLGISELGYDATLVLTSVTYDAMVKNNANAITPFVFCAAPSSNYTVQAVNTVVGWDYSYSDFYRGNNTEYKAGNDLYGNHYYSDRGIGLEFIIDSLEKNESVTISWISSLDTDIKATIDNIESETGSTPTPEPETPVTPPYSGGVYIPPSVDVPVSNNDTSVDVSATVSGQDATIAPLSNKQIEQLIGNTEAAGDVVIDLTGLGKNIDTAGIPKKSLAAIVDAAEKVGNDTEHLVIKLSTAELKLDDTALRAIVDQADGDVVKFNFDDVGLGRLNKEQKEAVKDMDIRKGYEAYITVNGDRVSDFKGGKVEILVPYAIPAGENTAGFSVWYIDEQGKAEKQKSTYDGKQKCFVVTHFSDYVIAYSEADAQANSHLTCPKDATCPIWPYTDASVTAWYHDGVHYCIENGLMVGVSKNNFAPDMTTSRAMIATILWRMEGEPVVNYNMTFKDVEDGMWYSDAVRWAQSVNVVAGYSKDKFGPNDSITREQMAAFLWRYCQYKGIDVSVGEDTNILSYEDAFDVSDWAYPAMQWACGSGTIGGIAKNGTMYLDPQGDAVRCQSATMLYRFCTEIMN